MDECRNNIDKSSFFALVLKKFNFGLVNTNFTLVLAVRLNGIMLMYVEFANLGLKRNNNRYNFFCLERFNFSYGDLCLFTMSKLDWLILILINVLEFNFHD